MKTKDDLPALILLVLTLCIGALFWLNEVVENDARVLSRGECAAAACPECPGVEWAEAYAACEKIIR